MSSIWLKIEVKISLIEDMKCGSII